MQVKIFTISLFDNTSATEELNAFLRGQKVLTIDKLQVLVGNQAYWSFCITYLLLAYWKKIFKKEI